MEQYETGHVRLIYPYVQGRVEKKCYEFTIWVDTCAKLSGIIEYVPIIKIFSHHVRSGLLAEIILHIRNHSSYQYLHVIGNIFDVVGGVNPCLEYLV